VWRVARTAVAVACATALLVTAPSAGAEASQPDLVPGGTAVTEGTGSPVVVSVPVRLSEPSTSTVTASWRTANYEAKAPADFVAASGTVTFAPGETRKSVRVTVVGDDISEYREAFLVVFSNATNARITGYGLSFVYIHDNDPLPSIRPGGASALEGSLDPKTMLVPVRLSKRSGRTVSVAWRTSDYQATASADYVAASGTVTFAPGETVRTVPVKVVGDRRTEPDEAYLVAFSDARNATLPQSPVGYGVIQDDDDVKSSLGAFGPSVRQLTEYAEHVGYQVRSGLAYASWKYDWATWRQSITSIVDGYTDPSHTFKPRLVLSVPMLVRADDGKLRNGANGAYDQHWRWLAQLLVREYGTSLPHRFVLRLGHESNILYYQWSARPDGRNGATAPEDFAAYWRRIHGIMTPIARAAGTDITWAWNIATIGDRPTAERSYPGNPYVDVVTVDFYDRTGNPDDILWNRPLSLEGWLVPFADARRKPIGVDEWSVYWNSNTASGGGDNPLFVSAVHDWLQRQVAARRLVWHHQFDVDTRAGTYHRMQPDGAYPFDDSRARFLQLFGE
jgi:hypothetical protein